MALVNVTNVVVLDNPTTFTNPLTFEVTFECLQELDADLEWKVIYVGSAEDERFDQVLEEVDVGPIPVGVNKFVLTAESPDPATIPPTDLVGVTVTLITCCYKQKEFIRVGYYVNNEHTDPAINAEIQEGRIPPAEMLDPARITRNILADKPRVTRFPIDWNAAPGDPETAAAEGETESGEGAMDESIMEDDDMVVGGEATTGEGGEIMDEEIVGEEDAEASESMGSEGEGEGEGEDDRSVDLEDEGSGGEVEGEADMDADSSGAEEMEDVGVEARAENASEAPAPETAAAPGILTPAASGGGDENVQPSKPVNQAVGPQQQTSNGLAQTGGVGQVNCGNGEMTPAANGTGGTLLF